jgi:cytochrome c-type biogenesis protein CcmH/NrfG
MPRKESQGNTLQIILITAVVSVAVGFFCGMGFSNYKLRGSKVVHRHSIDKKRSQKETIRKQYEARLSALRKEVSENPGNADAWTQLGNIFFDHGEVLQAIDAYKKSLEIEPKNANVLTDLGVMYRRNGEFHVAVEAFTRANTINPQHEVSLLNKGIVLLYDLKDTTGAVDAWENLIELNENVRLGTGQLITELIQSIK